jgi:hypothetical protein
VGGVGCGAGYVAVSLAAIPANADDQNPAPGHSIVVLSGASRRSVRVGPAPRLVAASTGILAVDVASEGQRDRAVTLVDPRTAKIMRTVALEGIDQLDALLVRGGFVYAIGGTSTTAIEIRSGRKLVGKLPAPNTGYAITS